MSNKDFFEERKEQSEVKSAIVSKYFWAWAKVIIPTAKSSGGKIAYIDLFAGPGRYKDGSKSTPLLILEQAVNDKDMRQMLVTLFNDVDKNNSHSLQEAINSLPDINNLKYRPEVHNQEVGDEIVKMFEEKRLVPTLFFVNPFGYKGLSLKLINSVIQNWGCDCIFFFNYNRINMGLGNSFVADHLDALFGKERADKLRPKLSTLSAEERELAIVEEIAEALKEMGGTYVLPFTFKNANGTRTSHHLIFVSKHIRGYTIMKEIMAKESSSSTQGVPSFAYNPASVRQPLLFELSRPLDDLEQMLLTEFAGRTLRMKDIFEEHNIDKPYIAKNYKQVLLQMEIAGKIKAEPEKRKKNTFGDDVLVTFPPLKKS